jgi:hypothetical protein
MFSLQGELILAVTYGYEVHGRDDKLLDASKRRNEFAKEVTPLNVLLLNHIPLCTHFLLLVHWQHD